MELENIILSEVTHTQKDMHGIYSLISGYYQNQNKCRIPRIQSTELKKVDKQKGPSEDVSILLGREKKAITGGGWRKGPGCERRQGGEEGNMIGYWVEEQD